MKFSTDELEAAKDFLRRRIESEQSMARDVESLLGEYAERLLTLLFRDAPQGEINALIDELIAQLIEDCYILGVDDRQDQREAIVLWMNSERHGDTLEGRIGSRARTFFNEVFAVYLAGKLLGLGQKVLLSSVRASWKHPWDNFVLVSVREKIATGAVAGNMDDFIEPHYGPGTEISSLGALQTLTGYAIADAWMHWQHEDKRREGMKGFYVLRGSSYPCDICQAVVDAGFHDMGDIDALPPFHNHCCCYVVYSEVERV